MDFLTFQTFISPLMLVIFYYIGAILIPLLLWFFSHKKYESVKNIVWKRLNFKHKTLFIFSFTMMILFMQLFWRMMFEFLIAYMQIHEALVG
ncbi:MAG: DUF4282 domain-containing protein [Sulfurovum sp.]|nr:DUF4282 domain-containing protein [Sulfurovum sp.]